MARQAEVRRKDITFLRLVFRFFTGRPLDGQRRTNAIFHRRATRSLDESGYASRWSMMSGLGRLAWRLLGLYVFAWVMAVGVAGIARRASGWTGGTAPGWAEALTWTAVAGGHAFWLALVGGPFLTWRLVIHFGITLPLPIFSVSRTRPYLKFEAWVPWVLEGRRGWEKRYVRPLAMATAVVLQTHYHPRTARKVVKVPRNYRDQRGGPVVILLPPTFTGADEGTKKRLTATVAARLGMRSPAVEWQLEGDKPMALFSAPPLPPSLVLFSQVRRFYEDSVEYRPFLGLAAREEALHAELVKDSPHAAQSAGSGAGKSEHAKGIIMQALRWGWGVVILDWKEVSHAWAEGLPGVRIVRDIGGIHDTLVRLGEEVDARKSAYRSDPLLGGRAKVLVVYEEMNATSDLLGAYWADLRSTAEPEERQVMPVKSPALRAQGSLVFGGRQFGMHCLYQAQRFSSRVTGGNTDLRENFQIKFLARFSDNTRKMLAPDIRPFPKSPNVLGQWVAVMGSEAVVYQAPLISDEEAREYALGGKENPPTPLATAWYPELTQRPNGAPALGDELGRDLADPAEPLAIEGEVVEAVVPMKLSDIAPALEYLGVTLDTFRNATKRREDFPDAIGGNRFTGYEYDLNEVTRWARRRHAEQKAERVRK